MNVTIHAEIAFHPNGARPAGNMKIADPMMLPTTSDVASQNPNFFGAHAGYCVHERVLVQRALRSETRLEYLSSLRPRQRA